MKKLIVRLTCLLLLVGLFSCSQQNKKARQNASLTALKSIQTIHYLNLFSTLPKVRFDSIFAEMIRLNKDGKISFYLTDSLKEPALLDDILTQFLGLALPDTNLNSAPALDFTIKSIAGIKIVERISPSVNKLNIDYKILAFAPVTRIDIGQNQYIRQPLLWIKMEDLKKHIPPVSYKTFINSIYVYLFNTEDYNMNPIERHVNQRKIVLNDFIGKFTVQEINETIYKKALKGEISAFTNDSLQSSYTIDEIKDLGKYEETLELAPDPDYPDYLVDSILVNYLRESDIIGNTISFRWSFNRGNHSYSKKLNAFGITYTLYAAGQNLGEQTLFWVDFKELEKALGKFRYQILVRGIMKENARLHSYYKFRD